MQYVNEKIKVTFACGKTRMFNMNGSTCWISWKDKDEWYVYDLRYIPNSSIHQAVESYDPNKGKMPMLEAFKKFIETERIPFDKLLEWRNCERYLACKFDDGKPCWYNPYKKEWVHYYRADEFNAFCFTLEYAKATAPTEYDKILKYKGWTPSKGEFI